VILAFHRGDDEARQFWEQALQKVRMPDANRDETAKDFAIALDYLKQTGSLEDTVQRAAHYGEKAKDALGLFAPSKTRNLLTQLVDFCIARAY
jgi:octaprenyl-diphosphate synthase